MSEEMKSKNERITDCAICGRQQTEGKGGWCITCFSLWYDGGPDYQDPEKVKIVSLAQTEPTFAPVAPKRWEGMTPIWDEIPHFEEASNYFGE